VDPVLESALSKPPPLLDQPFPQSGEMSRAETALRDTLKLSAVAAHLARGEPPRRVLGLALGMVLDLTGGITALLLVDDRVIEALGTPLERSLGHIELGERTRLVSRGTVADQIRDWEGSSAPIVSLEGADMVVPGARGGVKIMEPDCGALSEPGRVVLLHTLADLCAGLACLAADQVVAEQRARALEETRARFREQNMLLRELAVVDELTGLHNRRFFDGRLQYELARFGRYGSPLSLLVLDIDHFKQVNDGHGHPVGDQVLRQLAVLCKSMIRRVDLLARIGGEEFALLMPNTLPEGALAVATRLLDRVAMTPFEAQDLVLRLTVSMGLVTVQPGWHGDTAQLFRAADQALYRAKLDGRNRVVVAMKTA
jgi:diguanylate cyclase (GGDEF)-like protein